ncbi:helix-turn-helix domain-containing protein [Cryptosporangium sp. NPDC051539]|uniref:helix-turn-helix domain-containing protein n=1 Tax=Cryptosporangium sp. NPDC051539 TaxID=3363962 RepID=UPI003794F1D3
MGSDSEVPAESPLEGVGQQLRRARQAAGISVREMARRVDVSPSFISQVELGRTKPSVGTLYSIASELGVPLDDLMPIGQAVPVLAEAVPVPDERLALVQRGMLRPFGEAAANYEPGSPVQRSDRRHELRMGNAVWGRLTADHDPDNDFLHVVYAPGGESCPVDNMIHHRGHEYGYVISGTLEVQVGFNHYQLNAGDSISFASMTPHRLHNPADRDSVSLWMVVGRGGTPVL